MRSPEKSLKILKKQAIIYAQLINTPKNKKLPPLTTGARAWMLRGTTLI